MDRTQKASIQNVLGRLFFSFSAKILLLTCGITVLTSLLIGSLYYKKVEKVILQRELDKLSFEAQTMQPQFRAAFDKLATDVQVLSTLPPIQGIVRSRQNGGIDPLDGSTYELWRKRLEMIFQSMMMPYPHYIQIRYIAADENGQELVRVNRNGDKTETVNPEDLQKKGEEPYFAATKEMPPGSIYFSPINLNREHGKIQEPMTLVIRAAMPIYDDNNEIFGMIVVNSAFNQLMDGIIEKINPNKDLFIVNEDGNYFSYKKNKTIETSEMTSWKTKKNQDNDTRSHILPKISNDKLSETTVENINGEERVIHYHKFFFDPHHPDRFLAFVLDAPKSDLLQDAYKIRGFSIILGITLVALAVIGSAILSGAFRRPLKKMIQEIEEYELSAKPLNLPVARMDEIGEIAISFQDMTEKLERTNARLQAIMDTAVDGLITIDEYGTVQHYNRACEDIFGYSADEIIGQNVKILMPPDYKSEHDNYLRNYRNTGEKKIIGIGREVMGQRKDGSVFPLDLAVGEVMIQDQKLYSGIVRDITERKKAEDEIMRSNEELERFAYLASHDLQEPLRMVRNFTDLLNEEYGKSLDPQASKYMRFVIDSSARMQALVADLLEYSRVGSEETGFRLFDSRRHVDIVLNNLSDAISETQAELIIDDGLPEIYANPIRFSRLMQNLIGNAIKYRKSDGAPRIHIGIQENADEWQFSVEDNGIGIKKDYLEQIFVIFKRLHGKNEYTGTGIGLAICKKIVEGFEGKIWAESEPGIGTTFIFTVPKREIKRKAA